MSNDNTRFVVSIKIKPEPYQIDMLEKDYFKCNRLYNNATRYVLKQVKQIKKTRKYQNIVKLLKKDIERDFKKTLYQEIRDLMIEYKITKSDLEKYMKVGNKRAFCRSIKAQVFQTLAKELYRSVESSLYKGTEIKYRKLGTTNTLSSKAKNKTIILSQDKKSFKYNKKTFKLKPIRKRDYYLQEALDSEVAICQIVRKPIKNKYQYYLQIILKGVPPKKVFKGKGIIGIDQGTSTIALYKNDFIDFVELTPDIKKYNKEIVKIQRKMENKKRLNNPDCYNENGTFKKGSKITRSKSYQKELFKLKDAYRRKTVYARDFHNKLAKFIVSNCDTIVKETLNYKALQKRVKDKAVKQDKKTNIVNKKGEVKSIYKYKRKKRFGKSLNNHSPGYLNSQILKRAIENDVNIVAVDMLEYRASQYNHLTGKYIKSELKDRCKLIGDDKVQRDLYSAFLLCNYKDKKTIDRDKCFKEFDNFLKQQDELIKEIKDTTRNFGLVNFI